VWRGGTRHRFTDTVQADQRGSVGFFLCPLSAGLQQAMDGHSALNGRIYPDVSASTVCRRQSKVSFVKSMSLGYCWLREVATYPAKLCAHAAGQ